MRWLERLAEPWMVRAEGPTIDLYFMNACAEFLSPHGPVERFGPGVFASPEATLIIRHAGGAETVPERRRLFYVIDDDVEAAVCGTDVPLDLRAKYALFERRHGRSLLARGAEAVVSSDALGVTLAPLARCVHRIWPVWPDALLQSAPAREKGCGRPVRLAYLGSAAHRRDAAFALPILARVLAARSDVELHIAANHRLGTLARHPRVRLIKATDWPGYRAWLGAARLDIAIYPLLPGAVNRARSVNKLIEHAVAGAATVCSQDWPEAERVVRRRAGISLPPEPDAWVGTLLELIDDRAHTHALAQAGRRLALDLNSPGRQRQFWRHALSLDKPGGPF